jgi:hypothetical protein
LEVVLQSREVGGPNDFDATFAMMTKEHPEALLVFGDALITQHEKQIVDFVTQQHIPSSFPWRESVVYGGLLIMSLAERIRIGVLPSSSTRSSRVPNPATFLSEVEDAD